jgi:N-acetylglucosaminyldiphosphoundecaprenol N-acetyl-beta-D-mannosaminyltransferase
VSQRQLYGLSIDALTIDDVVALCADAIGTRQPLLLGVVNAAKIVNMRRQEKLRASLMECNLLLADGQSVVWASRLLGQSLPERVAGIDVFERLLAVADNHQGAIYLLGAQSDVLIALRQRIADRYPGIRVVGARDGYFSPDASGEVADEIRRAHPDMLFLGMASPKKENFLADYGASLGVPVVHGVGGSFDVFAGVTRRAPMAWRRLGFEWLYRLLQEPRRLWRRYLTTNIAFIGLTIREWVAPTPPYSKIGRSSVDL